MPWTLPNARIPASAPVAQGYETKDGTLVATGRASDLYSTARDLLTWLEANLGVLVAMPAEVAAALRWTHGDPAAGGAPYFSGADNLDCGGVSQPLPFDMGLAWKITHDQPAVWAKDGATSRGGGSAWVGFIPGTATTPGSGIAVLANLDGAAPAHLGLAILRALPTIA
jgi:Beta-lactamase